MGGKKKPKQNPPLKIDLLSEHFFYSYFLSSEAFYHCTSIVTDVDFSGKVGCCLLFDYNEHLVSVVLQNP